jgi:REP element-mobilizing transposase RayT
MFVELLQETLEAWNIRIAAYSLMPNHYHMLIKTPDANISRTMRHVSGVYTQCFNRRHHIMMVSFFVAGTNPFWSMTTVIFFS